MIDERRCNSDELQKLLDADEDHFFDTKGKDVQPSKLQETFVAFANADGGDIYVGLEDKKYQGDRVRPFITKEDANSIISVLLEKTSPSVENVSVEFLVPDSGGYLLHFSIPKSSKVHYTAGGDCFIRINASKEKIKGERVTMLAYSKGSLAYERVAVASVLLEEIAASDTLASYMNRIGTSLEPMVFLRKQRLLTQHNDVMKPNVGCVLLFDDEPQAAIETRCAVKVYRLRTTEADYKREYLAEPPATINGPVEKLIKESIAKVQGFLDGSTYYENGKPTNMAYPADAIKEVIVNAVIHRDYSLNDDIHIRIYDNRVEILSPGKLPGYMNISNLYDERFSRNPNIVRMLHNLPNPLNHDIGEGLDTVKNELKKAGLVAPEFYEKENAFVVVIRHEKIASVEDAVMEYLEQNPDAIITNKMVREISGEDDINKVKKALQKLRKSGKICLAESASSAFDYRYKKVSS